MIVSTSSERSFRDLIAWQKAMAVAQLVYVATRHFPADERFGLVTQCRRAATSVAANIAEGHGRRSPAYFIHFLRIARGSVSELDTELELAHRLGFLSLELWSELHEELDHTSRLLTNLSRALAKRSRKHDES